MSASPSCPRDDSGALLWGDAPGILIARLPSQRTWEPIIVTTLRRYARRGASRQLLNRLAGGAGFFNVLNQVWDLDGRALQRIARKIKAEVSADAVRVDGRHEVGDLGVWLGNDERRLALLQIISEYQSAGRMLPGSPRLARYFGVTAACIDNDLDMLRAQGRIRVNLNTRSDRNRVVRLAGTPA